jgi:hypothetical protein
VGRERRSKASKQDPREKNQKADEPGLKAMGTHNRNCDMRIVYEKSEDRQ